VDVNVIVPQTKTGISRRKRGLPKTFTRHSSRRVPEEMV
jgi:hypothetical protein